MSLQHLLHTSLKQLKCALTHHTVSEEDEDELFNGEAHYLKTRCSSCRYPIELRLDPADKERNYYMLTEL